MNSFQYVRPASLAEAAKALAAVNATAIAGGHTLLPAVKQRLAKPSLLVDLGGIAELKGIRKDGGAIVIGAGTTHAEVAANSEVKAAIPALAQLAAGIGDPQVRHRGTLGGSIANNDPAADYPAAVLGLGATVITNNRKIEADKFFTGLFSTALGRGEIVTAVSFPVPERAGYAKFEQRASRFCLVSVFAAKTKGGMFSGGEVRVAVSGAGANGVFRVPAMEQALKANFAVSAIAGIKVPENGLMTDMHGSPAYRAALISVMAEKALSAA
jgi:aerobic carbon-monoxide dehydrogenase medium subunit